MTQLILVRHGETLWNRERRMQGQRDSPLSDTGKHQARRLGQRLADLSFSVLYSSDLGRAYETARSVAAVTGHEIAVDTRLRERHFGVFEGLTSDEIESGFPAEFDCFKSRNPAYVIPGGESAQQFRDRCLSVLEEIAERHLGATVVVVTHGLVLDVAYREAHAIALGEPRPVPLLNASLNVFHYGNRHWRCETWGDVSHLQGGTVTHFESGSV
ncbi:MAG: histidine phosphatase family protein [Burkholderiales bacterium]|nr:histidine phosphatase family protein [Burkholderiales bacterium]